MTELLQHLRAEYTFGATPSFHDLGVYHVPFDDLVGGVTVEGRLRRGTHAGERIAVVGTSGSGKSSVISHVLGPDQVALAPILVPVMAMPPDRLIEPVAVLDRLIEVVVAAAQEAVALDEESAAALREAAAQQRGIERGRTRSATAGMVLGWLTPSLAQELRYQTASVGTVPVEQKQDVVEAVLRIIAGDDLQPVLVFDDTDRWLSGPSRDAVGGFFGGVLRMVNDLPASVVVAVHPSYFTRSTPRRRVLAHLDTIVEIPALPAIGGLDRLLGRRIAVHTAGTEFASASTADVFDERALDSLWEYYQSRGVYLRNAMQVAHRALGDCADQGESIVTQWYVHAAINAD